MAQVTFTEHYSGNSSQDTHFRGWGGIATLDSNAEYLAAFYASGSGAVTQQIDSLTGLGPTWSFVTRARTDEVNRCVEVWRGRSASPSGSNLSATWSGTHLRGMVGIYKATNAADSAPTNNHRTSGSTNSDNKTLSALGGESGTFYACGRENTEAVTLAGFTAHTQETSESRSFQVFTLSGQSADFTATWTTSTPTQSIALEIAAAAGAGSNTSFDVALYDSLAFEGVW